MNIKQAIRGMVPSGLLSLYHFILAAIAALWYGFPARKLVVIGVTGTKGKSTTAAMIWHVLGASGRKCALISTVQLALDSRAELNTMKMTMPSPFWLQRYLRRAVKNGCTHAVIETSSEGLAQWRHLGIPYAAAVLTNLTPEHIEAHGSYERYRAAKGRLFQAVRSGTSIINLDDGEAGYFLSFPGRQKVGYTLKGSSVEGAFRAVKVGINRLSSHGAEVVFDGVKCNLKVGGEFNVMNAAAAFAAAGAVGVPAGDIVKSLATFTGVPGRLEYVSLGQPFSVVVDYAHTAESLEALYKTLRLEGEVIAVLGATGGGRDKMKRVPMGKVAGKYARLVVVTDEDPYDEDPRVIMQTVAQGVLQTGKREGSEVFVEGSRRAAIARAFASAKQGDMVAITGKGAEQCIMRQGGRKELWDDRRVAREELAKLGFVLG